MTEYHAKYFSYELTRSRPSFSDDKLSTSLFNAAVDLNPHQIDAALYALRSPISQGVVLADEVGLGKTIEAGLVLCQYWAERKRKLLVVAPASLRKQWSLELEEKFNLPTIIIDKAQYHQSIDSGNASPFQQNSIVITSIHFAASHAEEIRAITWDVVVIDEAHKLRNVYRSSNKLGQQLKWALSERKKLLLTATPLQNSLLELYGLSTLIDDKIFVDIDTFRSRYMRQDSDLNGLRQQLSGFVKRTLRNDVGEYIQYTERRPITKPFHPSDEEHKFYETVSEFLRREDTYSIPVNQRTLTTLILRKLLASSSHAIAGTLDTMKKRLERLKEGINPDEDLLDEILHSDDVESDIDDEMDESSEGSERPQIDITKLNAEIEEISRYAIWARSIGVDTKSRVLLKALEIGFSEMQKMGANNKAIIFTESRRTQKYLKNFLEANGYTGKIALFSGTNTDPDSALIYKKWLDANNDTGRSTGSKTVDIRTALIENFRDSSQIMIATEAAAEGINLQFCSLVINYDLPWNPQRIEQRIGRCHRYGQKHDVVVVNFLNERNDADKRVLELLEEKFSLFTGVFGSSDEVLGSIESGIDFEKRILAIYQQCRTTQEIEKAFRELQDEMEASIRARIDETRKSLIDNFDEDVHARLKLQLDSAREQLDRVGKMFWDTTKVILRKDASFIDEAFSFDLHTPPKSDIHPGHYRLISKKHIGDDGAFLYRLSHPLGEHVLEQAKQCDTPVKEIRFDLTSHPTKISALDPLKGTSGWLVLNRFLIHSFEQEEYLLFSGFAENGSSIDQEICERLFRLKAEVFSCSDPETRILDRLKKESELHCKATAEKSLETNNSFFIAERERLERWADDMVEISEKELRDVKNQIKTSTRQARIASTVEEQHTIQEKIQQLEREKRKMRQKIFDVEDEIYDKRDILIDKLVKRIEQKTENEQLFIVRWKLI
jgi:hypothetical protein